MTTIKRKIIKLQVKSAKSKITGIPTPQSRKRKLVRRSLEEGGGGEVLTHTESQRWDNYVRSALWVHRYLLRCERAEGEKILEKKKRSIKSD